MQEISTQFLVLIPVVLGVVQVFRLTGLPTRLVPLTALLLGVAGAFIIGGVHLLNIIPGIIAGLSSMGLYSGTKTTTTPTTLS